MAGEDITASIEALINSGQRFGTIYADPPWRYKNKASRGAAENHYPTMTLESIAALPVSKLAADVCHLHLWTTTSFLPHAVRILDAWGFEYRSEFIWIKPQMGLGNYWRVSHEYLLLGTRGPETPFTGEVRSWDKYPRGKHSAKPPEIRDMVRSVSPGPWLEMFGRSQHDGWTVIGNQAAANG